MKQTLAIWGLVWLGGFRAMAGVFGPATNVPDVDKTAMAVATGVEVAGNVAAFAPTAAKNDAWSRFWT